MRTSLSGPVLQAFHATLPVAPSSAVSQPRTPSSPPLLPTSTLPFTMSGAIVIVSPLRMSPSVVLQRWTPVRASTATVRSSRVLKTTRPLSYAAPRLTTSQHATPCDAGSGAGEYFHFTGADGWVRSSANRSFGYGVTTYIVPPTTRGAASCPLALPVAKLALTARSRTRSTVISPSGL